MAKSSSVVRERLLHKPRGLLAAVVMQSHASVSCLQGVIRDGLYMRCLRWLLGGRVHRCAILHIAVMRSGRPREAQCHSSYIFLNGNAFSKRWPFSVSLALACACAPTINAPWRARGLGLGHGPAIAIGHPNDQGPLHQTGIGKA